MQSAWGLVDLYTDNYPSKSTKCKLFTLNFFVEKNDTYVNNPFEQTMW